MCGIAGFTKLEHQVDSQRIEQAIHSIHHRGPDEQGWHQSDLIALGTARLAILDLAHGHQPMFANGNDVVIAFNGEIYNHAEVRRELEAEGHRFDTHCDTEVVLRGFLQWDTGVFSRLRGMFGVALWCESRRRLVLARDRLGIKPLYLYHRGRDLYFGSELKTILIHPEIPRRLDLNGLSHYLSLNWVPAPYTLVEGIEKVAPGEYVEWENGQVHRAPYWSIRIQPDSKWTLPDAKEELDRLLQSSIREHLISDVPLGVWASGGLDSSTVLHYAAQEVRGLNTFSVSFLGHSHDESRYFREVAQVYGTQHHEFDLSAEADIENTIRNMVYYSDEPSADAGALPVWFLSQMTRKHVTVALSGEGADEIFGGYQTYRADLLAPHLRAFPPYLRKLGLQMLKLFPVSDAKISFEYKAKRFLEGSLLSPAASHLFWNGAFGEAMKQKLYKAPRYPNPSELMNTLPTEAFSSGEVNPFLWLDQRYYLADDILYKCDRMSMAHSLEVRPPFLDHRIVDFAGSLPESFKIRESNLKFILRDLMQGKLPQSVLTRPKEGFDIPTHRWFRGVLRPLLDQTLSEKNVRATGLFNWEAIRAVKDAHQSRRANYGYPLWGLLTLFLWMERWKIESATALA